MSVITNEGYFTWLCGLTGQTDNRNPARTHFSLYSQLHATPFEWSVANDDNRNEDGKSLREEFLDTIDIDAFDEPWMELNASMLEVFIALSRRLAFESYGTSEEWFWKLLENLNLNKNVDSKYNAKVGEAVNAVLERVIFRTYTRNGQGGLFPLKEQNIDQRKTEIWYQLSAYLLESSTAANGP